MRTGAVAIQPHHYLLLRICAFATSNITELLARRIPAEVICENRGAGAASPETMIGRWDAMHCGCLRWISRDFP